MSASARWSNASASSISYRPSASAAAPEVMVLEHAPVRLAVRQRVDRSGPEGPPDHRRRLEGRLLGRVEQVDPRCEHSVNRIRHGELARKLVQHPAAEFAVPDSI